MRRAFLGARLGGPLWAATVAFACGPSDDPPASTESPGGAPTEGTGGNPGTAGPAAGGNTGAPTPSTGGAGGVATPSTGGSGGVDESCTGAATPDGRLWCDVLADYTVRCDPTASRQGALDSCHEGRVTPEGELRIDCRMITGWAGCMDDIPCEEDMADCGVAAYSPVVDAATLAACVDSGDCPDDGVLGLLTTCVERAQACDVLDDICANASLLQDSYRSQMPSCIQLGCEQLNPCLRSLTADE